MITAATLLEPKLDPPVSPFASILSTTLLPETSNFAKASGSLDVGE